MVSGACMHDSYLGVPEHVERALVDHLHHALRINHDHGPAVLGGGAAEGAWEQAGKGDQGSGCKQVVGTTGLSKEPGSHTAGHAAYMFPAVYCCASTHICPSQEPPTAPYIQTHARPPPHAPAPSMAARSSGLRPSMPAKASAFFTSSSAASIFSASLCISGMPGGRRGQLGQRQGVRGVWELPSSQPHCMQA